MGERFEWGIEKTYDDGRREVRRYPEGEAKWYAARWQELRGTLPPAMRGEVVSVKLVQRPALPWVEVPLP